MPRYYKQKLYTDDERKIIGEHTRIKMLEREAPKAKKSTKRKVEEMATDRALQSRRAQDRI